MTDHMSRGKRVVHPSDYERMTEVTQLCQAFAHAASLALIRDSLTGKISRVMTQDERLDAQYITEKLQSMPVKTHEEVANYCFFQLGLIDIFAQMADRAEIPGFASSVPPDMATRETAKFLTHYEMYALALLAIDASPNP